MELKTYLRIILRWWWAVVGVTIVALGASLLGFFLIPQAVSYGATVNLAVRPVSEPKTGNYYTYDEYYAYLASEYINDDVIELIQGSAFRAELNRRLQADYPAGATGSIKAKKAHRVMSISVSSPTSAEALALALATAESLTDTTSAGRDYFSKVSEKESIVSIVDPPTLTSVPGTRSLLDLALRGLVGLFLGLGLAFLLEYLDESVRDSAELERLLGAPVLAELPSNSQVDGASRRSGRVPSRA